MAIKIIEGVPGAGKTYYAIKHVFDKYFKVSKDGQISINSDVQIITNIDGFKGQHIPLVEKIKEAGGVKQFFSNSNQKVLFEQIGPIVYVIDESQMIFDRKFYDRDVFAWLEYHRHYGQTIYLVTQSSLKLPKDITLLVEYIIRALPRSRSITGKEFRYNHMSGKDVLKRDILPLQKKYFDFYKSADAEEVEKVKNPFLSRIGFYLVLIVLGIGGSLHFITTSWSNTPPGVAHKEKMVSQFDPHEESKKEFPINSNKYSLQSDQTKENSGSEFSPIVFNYVYSLNYIGTYGNKTKLQILFNGSVYSIRDFPYPIELHGGNIKAIIPSQDFEFLFEDLPPARKWHKRIIKS